MTPWPLAACPECGACEGDPHWPGCGHAPPRDVAEPQKPGYEAGQAAGIRECRRRGWAVIPVQGEGLRPCSPEEPGSYVDLDRYAYWLENGDGAIQGNEPAAPDG